MKPYFQAIVFGVLCNIATCCTANGQSSLNTVKDIPLPGGANRFDYQSIDQVNRRLYISHMNSNAVIVFDLDKQSVVADIKGISRPTGILAVPETGKVYVSASRANEVVVIDEHSLKVIDRIPSGTFPDGIAYDPDTKRIYISDERGKEVTVIDARTDRFITNIEMGGEVGNTHYDPVSRKIFSAVQTKGQLDCIDPASNTVTRHFDLKECKGPHGFYIDSASHYALVTGEENARLIVFDLTSEKVVYSDKVGADPDVLAFDDSSHTLFVSSESGIVSVYRVEKNNIKKISEGFIADRAHTICVDQKTHLIYLPLEDINGKPVLRVMKM